MESRFVRLLLLHLFMEVLLDAVNASTLLQKTSTSYFDGGYTHLFGEDNLMVQSDGKTVHLSLDRDTGAGFVSHDLYQYGFFSASIKLPADYTAGVVVAFYMSNGDIFENNHDEIDFEFLGNIRGKNWRVQTNVYGNGSTATGREERYSLWFDPSEEFHNYSILWTDPHIVFYIDDVPIREVKRVASMAANYPAKRMSLYTTIWDGSDWATSGGRYKVNYKLAPYTAKFSDLVLHGCAVDPMDLHHYSCDLDSDSNDFPVGLSLNDRSDMESFREQHVTYSYCYDRDRYPSPLSECTIEPGIATKLGDAGTVKFGRQHHRHHRPRRSEYATSGSRKSH